MTQRPRFTDLPGEGPQRMVGGVLMDQERYEVEGWFLVEKYPVPHPHRPGCEQPSREVEVWAAGSLAGIQEYGRRIGQRREGRRSSWQARVDRDEEYSAAIEEMIEKGREEG